MFVPVTVNLDLYLLFFMFLECHFHTAAALFVSFHNPILLLFRCCHCYMDVLSHSDYMLKHFNILAIFYHSPFCAFTGQMLNIFISHLLSFQCGCIQQIRHLCCTSVGYIVDVLTDIPLAFLYHCVCLLTAFRTSFILLLIFLIRQGIIFVRCLVADCCIGIFILKPSVFDACICLSSLTVSQISLQWMLFSIQGTLICLFHIFHYQSSFWVCRWLHVSIDVQFFECCHKADPITVGKCVIVVIHLGCNYKYDVRTIVVQYCFKCHCSLTYVFKKEMESEP